MNYYISLMYYFITLNKNYNTLLNYFNSLNIYTNVSLIYNNSINKYYFTLMFHNIFSMNILISTLYLIDNLYFYSCKSYYLTCKNKDICQNLPCTGGNTP